MKSLEAEGARRSLAAAGRPHVLIRGAFMRVKSFDHFRRGKLLLTQFMLCLFATRIRAMMGNGTQYPTQFEIFGYSDTSQTNPDLRPEQLEGREIGIEQRLLGRTLLSIALFHILHRPNGHDISRFRIFEAQFEEISQDHASRALVRIRA